MSEQKNQVNILVTLDENYIPQLNVMLSTLLRFNPGCDFDVYLLHTSIRKEALTSTENLLCGRGRLIPVDASDMPLSDAPTTSRYPKEIYYRIFAAKYLPETVNRVLYLDPDLVINGSILPLYNLPMEDYFYAAASHIGNPGLIHKFNELRLDMGDDSPYINSGVLLMNLELVDSEPQKLMDRRAPVKELGVLLDKAVARTRRLRKIAVEPRMPFADGF